MYSVQCKIVVELVCRVAPSPLFRPVIIECFSGIGPAPGSIWGGAHMIWNAQRPFFMQAPFQSERAYAGSFHTKRENLPHKRDQEQSGYETDDAIHDDTGKPQAAHKCIRDYLEQSNMAPRGARVQDAPTSDSSCICHRYVCLQSVRQIVRNFFCGCLSPQRVFGLPDCRLQWPNRICICSL